MKLLYITNQPKVAEVAEKAGVDWIFVDLEFRGKRERQSGRDTVISQHTMPDVKSVREVVRKSELLVRVNPIGDWSQSEITAVIDAGADIVMLPYFKSAGEVRNFVRIVGSRAKTCLLLETLEAIEAIEEIVSVPGIDFVHIGLNDIHIAKKSLFMFEFLSEGGIDLLAGKLKASQIPFGFGGMGRIGHLVPLAERILAEHYRVGSTAVILSRSFIHWRGDREINDFESQFVREVQKIRSCEQRLAKADPAFFERNRLDVIRDVQKVVLQIREQGVNAR